MGPTSVRIVDHDLQVEVGKYLGLIASALDQDVRRMTISTTGSGERSLYVSYISEVPIWKTTYRIVLPGKAEKKPCKAGLASITRSARIGTMWNSLWSLVPRIRSFSKSRNLTMDAAPSSRCPKTSNWRRKHMPRLSGNGRLSGQVTDATGAVVPGASVRLLGENGVALATTFTDSSGSYSFSSLPSGQYRLEFQHAGFKQNVLGQLNVAPGENSLNSRLQVGTATETVEVSAEASTLDTATANVAALASPPVANRARLSTGFGSGAGRAGGLAAGPMAPPPSNLDLAREMASTAATGQDLGDLFEYKLKDRVTLKENQSALVPIAQTEITADKVSLWSGTTGSGRPLRALWLKTPAR